MSQVSLGPVNITYGNLAFFTAEFYDANGNLTVPSGATLSLTYRNLSNFTQTDTSAMTLDNSFYNGSWSSINAAPGIVPWTVTAAGFSTAAQAGLLRILDP